MLYCPPRWPSGSPTPPPSAPILGLLPRGTDCAKEPLDSLLHLIADDVADEGDEVRRSRHGPPSPLRIAHSGRDVHGKRISQSSVRSGRGKLGYRSEPKRASWRPWKRTRGVL